MSYLSPYVSLYTEPNADPVVVGEHYELSDARIACQSHLSTAWESTHGAYKLLDPRHSYDRGAFSQWGGISRIYVTTPNGDTAHYDIVERTW